MDKIQTNINKLNSWFSKHTQVLIALSGGIDSCLVAYMARQALGKTNAIAVISNSASLKEKDLVDARDFALNYDIQLIEIDANEINDINYSSNPINRCYYCKSNLYKSIRELANTSYPNYEITNGNNYDDMGDYRPGMQAADEFQVFSPLLECGINKESIRQISQHFNLKIWNKPASPCLSSRFPYGEAITSERLNMIENAENLLNTNGFNEVRVRYRKGNASIEVPHNEIPRLKSIFSKQVQDKIAEFGFKTVHIDEEGLISGKLNRDINKSR
ncbi:ATP-dependent sacrificial sulfur transferase LarE [Saccharicrinis fermentans]|uniref:NAD synthetase n=1 Tax=Saccharicrinis fermentans DSM 9555 = JCM 21142 TaxID=869213 RepID=W7YN52_9BACT|nr:ATP-dependent sacrificial sulfur transferase LarE [Saccharicrinis fermentans]GAF03844.1 NAD synthetase [Saccharicrinis fermentans DSM 9555 = JCM 21142]